MTTNDASQPPLQPNPAIDFICGRGGDSTKQQGNQNVLDIIELYLTKYSEAKRASKNEANGSKYGVALMVVSDCRAMGVRFIAEGPDGTYYELLDDDSLVYEVQQKFRDAPKRMWLRLQKEWRERQTKNERALTATNDVHSTQANTQYNNNCLSVGVAISQDVGKTSKSRKDFVLKYQLAMCECLEVLEALQAHVEVQAFKKKLEDGCYCSKEEFELDVHRTLDDAMSNTSEGTDAHKCAKAMKDKFVDITQRQAEENAERKRKQEIKSKSNKRQKKSNPAAKPNAQLKSVEQQKTPVEEPPSQQPVSPGNDDAREAGDNRVRQLESNDNRIINGAMSNNPEKSRVCNRAKALQDHLVNDAMLNNRKGAPVYNRVEEVNECAVLFKNRIMQPADVAHNTPTTGMEQSTEVNPNDGALQDENSKVCASTTKMSGEPPDEPSNEFDNLLLDMDQHTSVLDHLPCDPDLVCDSSIEDLVGGCLSKHDEGEGDEAEPYSDALMNILNATFRRR